MAQAQTQPKTDSQRERVATSSTTNALNTTETRFVQETLQGGRHEVEMARMALTQGSDSKVKSFAQRLVNDHTAANTKLEGIAKKNGISTSTDASAKERTTAKSGTDPKTNTPTASPDSHLSSLKGAEFDKAFVQQMITNHESGVAKYEAMQRDAKNADLKNYVSSTLPTLRQHLEQARTLGKETGAK